MVNIPTDLLRTLVAVVDLRSFTRAAQSLGITQPAVSAQIKRLQFLLGADLLDKSAPGVSLTSDGEVVVKYVRQLLAINDHIVDLATPRPSRQTLRIGMTGDFPAAQISIAAAQCRAKNPDLTFVLASGPFDKLLRELREGDLDIVAGFSAAKPLSEPRQLWSEELVWVSAPNAVPRAGDVLPIVTYGEECIFHRIAITASKQAFRDIDLVYSGPSIFGIAAAVGAGLGLTVLPRRRATDFPDLAICNHQSLPPLPEMAGCIYVREGAGRELREHVADLIAARLAPDRVAPPLSAAIIPQDVTARHPVA